MSTACRDAALFYHARGVVPVRVEHRGKRPIGEGWQKLRPTVEDIKRWPVPCNLGLLLGSASGWWIDIDLDCPEAIEQAPFYLPESWVFGRASKPRSHWIYICEGATSHRFIDHNNVTTLEVRAETGAGPGHQTVVPPSVHASGEPIEWDSSMADATESPRVVKRADMVDQITNLTRATIAMRWEGMTAEEARVFVANYKPRPAKQPVRRTVRTPDGGDRLARARAYVAKMDGAIAGCHGHDVTYKVALALVQGFALSESDAMDVMREFNARCQPPWSERELEHKVKSAATATRVTTGYLLDDERQRA